MKKAAIIIFMVLISSMSHAAVFEGGVTKQGAAKLNQVIDLGTNLPIENAQITLPQKAFKTYTDGEGRFNLGAKIDGQTIISVEKSGYKPFSLTVDERIAARPMVLGIEKTTAQDILVATELIHIGDNSFSGSSANAGDFRSKAVGPFYTKQFYMTSNTGKNQLVIGTIIGIDTAMAQAIGQNQLRGAYSTPPEVYFNGAKIAEIQVNGDAQKIKLPNALIKPNARNEITIKTGRNVSQTSYIDYDDIELINLRIETE